jgi:hypothetical protein
MVAHACNPNQAGDRDKRITEGKERRRERESQSKAGPGQSMTPYVKDKLKEKDGGTA